MYGQLKFGFGSVKVNAFSATMGGQSTVSLSELYGSYKLAAPSAELNIGRTKAYAGLGSIEERMGGTTPGGWQEVVQTPDASVKADLTPEAAKNIGRVGAAVGYKYFEVGAELDVVGLYKDLTADGGRCQ